MDYSNVVDVLSQRRTERIVLTRKLLKQEQYSALASVLLHYPKLRLPKKGLDSVDTTLYKILQGVRLSPCNTTRFILKSIRKLGDDFLLSNITKVWTIPELQSYYKPPATYIQTKSKELQFAYRGNKKITTNMRVTPTIPLHGGYLEGVVIQGNVLKLIKGTLTIPLNLPFSKVRPKQRMGWWVHCLTTKITSEYIPYDTMEINVNDFIVNSDFLIQGINYFFDGKLRKIYNTTLVPPLTSYTVQVNYDEKCKVISEVLTTH